MADEGGGDLKKIESIAFFIPADNVTPPVNKRAHTLLRLQEDSGQLHKFVFNYMNSHSSGEIVAEATTTR